MISAIVLCKNEGKVISACLKSLKFCEEVILIDDFSTDNSIAVAEKYTQKIYQKKLNNDFAGLRNYGLTKAKNRWVLFIDADEFVSKKLQREILTAVKSDKYSGYFLPRKDIFLGKKMQWGELCGIKPLRLGLKNAGKWVRPVHEIWNITGATGTLTNSIIHRSHKSIGDFLEKINYYSTIDAQYLVKSKTIIKASDIFLYPAGKFIVNYFIKLGFLDGVPGFIMSIMMSFNSFLTRSKAYLQLNKHEQE